MSPDSISTVSTESWGSRLGNAIKSVLVGIVLFLVSFPLLFWNESRAVKTTSSIKEVAATVDVTATPGVVDPSKNETLIHLSGEATTDETLTDDEFGVAAVAIKLYRSVEMYQWEEEEESETRKKTGGGEETTTTYTYTKDWSEGRNDSSQFERPEGHENPTPQYWANEIIAKKVTLGAFTLSNALVGDIANYTDLRMTGEDFDALPEAKKAELKLSDGKFYLPYGSGAPDDPAEKGDPAVEGERGGNAAEDEETGATERPPGDAPVGEPQLGDLRISFQIVKPQPVSIIAKQVGESFSSFHTKSGRDVEWLYEGTLTAEQMCDKKHTENAMLTWILRLVGFLVMAFGIGLVFRPLVVVADVIPMVGNVLGAGVFVFAIVIALPLTLSTIAVSWFAVRPVLGVILLVAAVGIIVGAKMLSKKKKTPA